MKIFPRRAVTMSARAKSKRPAFQAGLVAAVLIAATVTGCSAGQQSQTATQEPAVNGASGGNGTVALRDVRIRAEIPGAALAPGESVDLLFVAVNQSQTDNNKLTGITSDIGTVTLTPASPEIPARHSLMVGKPEGVDAAAMQALSDSVQATAKVKLSKPVANALTYDFVFTFERGGQVTIGVPVTPGESALPAGEGH